MSYSRQGVNSYSSLLKLGAELSIKLPHFVAPALPHDGIPVKHSERTQTSHREGWADDAHAPHTVYPHKVRTQGAGNLNASVRSEVIVQGAAVQAVNDAIHHSLCPDNSTVYLLCTAATSTMRSTADAMAISLPPRCDPARDRQKKEFPKKERAQSFQGRQRGSPVCPTWKAI